jgi:steroid delta-isomerase
MTMRRRLFASLAVLTLACLPAAGAAFAADATARAEIEAALVQWKDDFNAGRADRVCDLFARELRADFRGIPERGYDAQCDLLRRSLADPVRAYSYALAIREILVFGDAAVVRLTWTLTVRERDSGRVVTSVEPGIDVFRRARDSRWRILRYMAYEQ